MGIGGALKDALAFVTGDVAKKQQAQTDIANQQAIDVRTQAATDAEQAEKDKATTLTVEDEEKKRRARLLSGISTGSLGIDPETQTVGRARLLG